ncbi:MAG: DUF308 domain-containing protein [Methanobacteriaceae archaeon]|uniref:DUF308 domain-containing protein n=1 Tax=Methanobrevibacter TaxID=2172 RepID=UPI00375DE81E|nr:DUF308 domain-containing protein [Methanobacteriaceae archaeon]MDD4593621.1 DUF308 domain-containing protein [Methanobacteriaceae archaeon]
MKKESISIIAIILGVIIIAFPMLGVIGASSILGLSILLMSIFLLVTGVSEIDYSKTKCILYLIIGIVMLVLSLGLIFNPSLFAFLAALTIYLAGLFLIVIGLIILITSRETRYGFWIGIIGIILGVIYIIVGTYIQDPTVLGALIGIWLILAGILNLLDR